MSSSTITGSTAVQDRAGRRPYGVVLGTVFWATAIAPFAISRQELHGASVVDQPIIPAAVDWSKLEQSSTGTTGMTIYGITPGLGR